MLPPELVSELRYVEVYTAKHMRNLRLGTFTSRLRGAGFDFDEHRRYRAGDDVRRIDWNVTARLQTPFVRETHADRELNIVIAMDLTRSMAFGTVDRPKRGVMLFIAACLVFSALADGVNVGFVAFTDRVLMYRPPRRARARAWSLLEEIWRLDPPPAGSAIVPVARFLTGHLRKASSIFLVSDFMTDEKLDASSDLKVLAATHDVIAVVVEDPAEAELPAGRGAVRFRDLESGAAVRIGLSDRIRGQYRDLVHGQRRDLTEALYRIPIDHLFVRSDRSAIAPLMRLFAERKRL
jgi:uncharacterized protein (DUF58 family)